MPDGPPAQQHTTPQMEEGEVAESNRRGKRAVDEHPDDEVFADAVDDDALDAVDDETDDFESDDDFDDPPARRGCPARWQGRKGCSPP